MSKLVCQLNNNGVFVGMTSAQQSPLEPGVFLIPAGAIDVPPPSVPSGSIATWDGSNFVITVIPTPPAPSAPTPTTPQEQIITLENRYLMPRATREFMLLQMQKDAQEYAAANPPLTAAQVLAANPGYQAVYAFDQQIIALRNQI